MIIFSPFNVLKILLLSLILIFGGCETFSKERKYSKNGLTVTYRSLARFGSEITRYRVTPSSNITAETVSSHLLSLLHRRIQPPGKAKPIFSQKQVDSFSPLLAKALRKAPPNRYLHFEFQSSTGWTEGDVFTSVNKLHWRLLKIEGEGYSNDPLRLRKPTWKLVRARGQRFHKVNMGAGRQKSQENWVIATVGLKAPKRRATSPKQNLHKFGLKRKIKALKELLDDGIIGKKEYQQKKKILLNQHP